MATKIVNPTGETRFYTTAGAAIGSTTQPNNVESTATGPGTVSTSTGDVRNSSIVKKQELTINRNTFPSDTLTANDLFGGAGFTTSGTNDDGVTYTSNVGDTESLNDSGVAAGDLIYVAGYITKLVSLSADEITYEQIPVAAGSVDGNTLYILKRDLLKGDAVGQYVGIMLAEELRGAANTAILSGTTGPDRGVNKTEKIRTTRTATAINAGYWDKLNGAWTTKPTVADDSTDLTITSDNAPTDSGKVTFLSGSATPTNTAYNS